MPNKHKKNKIKKISVNSEDGQILESNEYSENSLKNNIERINHDEKAYEVTAEHTLNTKRIKILSKFSLSRTQKIIILVFLFIYVFVLVGFVWVYKNLYTSYKIMSANLSYSQDIMNMMLSDIGDKNISQIDYYFAEIKNSLYEVESEINKYEFVKELDQLSGYYNNFLVAKDIIQQIDNILDITLPKLKITLAATGFEVDEDDYEPNIDQQTSATQLVIKEIPQYINLYYQIETDIYKLFSLIKKLDLTYIPSVGGTDIQGIVNKLNNFIDVYPYVSQSIMSFAEELPELLGSHKKSRYLVVMQNETEMRPSGGLFTAYGVINVENGKIVEDINFTDMWNLEIYLSYTLGIDVGYRNFGAQNHLMMGANHLRSWSCGSSYLRAQDVGIYPDLYQVSMMFKDYYDIANRYNPGEYPEYDYILIINYAFTENLFTLIQPLIVEPYGVITAENLYDIIKSETDNTQKFGAFSKDRKKILADIATKLKEKFFSIPIEEMPNLLKIIVGAFRARDVSLSSKNQEMQAFFDEYGLTARTDKEFLGDFFVFSEGQNCSLKLNKWIRNEIEHNIFIEETGSIRKDIEVRWVNEKVYHPSLFAQYDKTLQYAYRAWSRFFFPEGSTEIWSNGYEKSGYLLFRPQIYFDEKMKRQTIDAAIQFDHRRLTEDSPPARHSMNASWRLPDSLNYYFTNSYRLLLEKHPGKSWGEKHIINIHYKGNVFSTTVTLDRDKVLTFKDGVIIVENHHDKLNWIDDLISSFFGK